MPASHHSVFRITMKKLGGGAGQDLGGHAPWPQHRTATAGSAVDTDADVLSIRLSI